MMGNPFALAVVVALVASASAPTSTDVLRLRDHDQKLRLYGTRGAPPVAVASGDGGWVHLAPHVAEALAARGCYVVGFDSKAYLAGFTTRTSALDPRDVPKDFKALLDWARGGANAKPLLVGVSEGAGLSVLAAGDETHGVPNEPTFSAAEVVGRVSPLPLLAIHSTGDEFVPLEEVRRIMARAGEPKDLWVVQASDHRFSDATPELERRLEDALGWIRAHAGPADH
jgi:alpha-beta hydrolase superfamily lysophospholipase